MDWSEKHQSVLAIRTTEQKSSNNFVFYHRQCLAVKDNGKIGLRRIKRLPILALHIYAESRTVIVYELKILQVLITNIKGL